MTEFHTRQHKTLQQPSMDHFNDDDFLLDGDGDDELFDDDDVIALDPTVHNLLEQDSLQWIFVGGKVGTTQHDMQTSHRLLLLLSLLQNTIRASH